MSRVLTAALLLAAIGCRAKPQPVVAPAPVIALPAPPPVSMWPTTLADILRDAEAGQYDAADRRLTQHALDNPGTADGAESDFWRAMLKADPANPVRTVRERMALLDAYLAATPVVPARHLEASIMRRLLDMVDSTGAVLTTVRASAETRQRTRDEEIKRLTDELDRTTAELERIRKRLTNRPPPG